MHTPANPTGLLASTRSREERRFVIAVVISIAAVMVMLGFILLTKQ